MKYNYEYILGVIESAIKEKKLVGRVRKTVVKTHRAISTKFTVSS